MSTFSSPLAPRSYSQPVARRRYTRGALRAPRRRPTLIGGRGTTTKFWKNRRKICLGPGQILTPPKIAKKNFWKNPQKISLGPGQILTPQNCQKISPKIAKKILGERSMTSQGDLRP